MKVYRVKLRDPADDAEGHLRFIVEAENIHEGLKQAEKQFPKLTATLEIASIEYEREKQ